MLSFYIALYSLNDVEYSNAWHVALVATEPNTTLPNTQVHIFQIVTQQEGFPGEDAYMAKNLVESSLPEPTRCLCAIRLPDLKMTIPELEEYMQTQYAGQRGTPQIKTSSNKWNCSQWVLRAIHGLVAGGHMQTKAKNSFYTPAAAKFGFWKQMMYDSCTKVAHDFTAQRNAAGDGPSEEVPVFDLSAFDINI